MEMIGAIVVGLAAGLGLYFGSAAVSGMVSAGGAAARGMEIARNQKRLDEARARMAAHEAAMRDLEKRMARIRRTTLFSNNDHI